MSDFPTLPELIGSFHDRGRDLVELAPAVGRQRRSRRWVAIDESANH